MNVCENIEHYVSLPSSYTFSYLIDGENGQKLEKDHPKLWKLVNLMAYGTISDLDSSFGDDENIKNKMRQLTLITLASKNKSLSYSSLMSELYLPSVRSLEDLVIDAIYKGLIKARLDSKQQTVLVDDWQSRDIKKEQLPSIVKILQSCVANIEEVSKEVVAKAIQEELDVTAESALKETRANDLENAKQAMDDEIRKCMSSGTGRNPLGVIGHGHKDKKRLGMRKATGVERPGSSHQK